MQGTEKLPRRKKKKQSEGIRECAEDGGISYNDAEAFADKLTAKQPQTFRCASHNMNILPESMRHYKSLQLTNHIQESQYDLVMFQEEVRLYWSMLDPLDQWEEWVRNLPNSTVIFAHNALGPKLSRKLQYGGV